MVLNRNLVNFFAETEKRPVVLRIFSLDSASPTIPCCKGAFTPIWIGRPVAWTRPTSKRSRLTRLYARHNNQRNGMHRQAVNQGRSTYELSCSAAAAHANPERFADCHW